MKRALRVLFSLILACSFIPALTAAQVDEQTKISLYSAIRGIEFYVNKKDVDTLLRGLSPSARAGLAEELRNSFPPGTISFLHTSWEFEALPDGLYRAEGRTTLQVNNGAYHWNTSGFEVFYILENVDGGWVIVDTNLPEILSGSNIQDMMKIVLPIAAGLGLIGLCFFVYLLFIRPHRVKSPQPPTPQKP